MVKILAVTNKAGYRGSQLELKFLWSGHCYYPREGYQKKFNSIGQEMAEILAVESLCGGWGGGGFGVGSDVLLGHSYSQVRL